MFRASKGLLSGAEALAQALSASSRIFGLLRVLRLRRGKKSMRHTCLALGFRSHTSHTIWNKRFVISSRIVFPSSCWLWLRLERIRSFPIRNYSVDLIITLCCNKCSWGQHEVYWESRRCSFTIRGCCESFPPDLSCTVSYKPQALAEQTGIEAVWGDGRNCAKFPETR